MEQIGYMQGQLQAQPNLDAIFSALADPTRRAILSRLVEGEAAVNEIAAPFAMSQPAVSRHLKVLEKAGLIERNIDEQRRPARLKAQEMAVAVDWLQTFEVFWGESFDQLDTVLLTMQSDDATAARPENTKARESGVKASEAKTRESQAREPQARKPQTRKPKIRLKAYVGK